jgi:hypothetical protein
MMLVCLASGQDEHVVRTDGTVDRWESGWDDMSSGRLTGNLKSSILFAVQSLLKMLSQVESLFTTSLRISDFVQTQNEAKLLTVSVLGVESNKASACSSNVSRSMSPPNAVRLFPNWSSILVSLTVSSTISFIAHPLLAPHSQMAAC